VYTNNLNWALAVLEVAMTCSAYLLVVATFERYLVTAKSPLLNVIKNKRLVLIAFAVLIGIVFKGTKALEIEVYRRTVVVFMNSIVLQSIGYNPCTHHNDRYQYGMTVYIADDSIQAPYPIVYTATFRVKIL
jgi:hypothetical protein